MTQKIISLFFATISFVSSQLVFSQEADIQSNEPEAKVIWNDDGTVTVEGTYTFRTFVAANDEEMGLMYGYDLFNIYNGFGDKQGWIDVAAAEKNGQVIIKMFGYDHEKHKKGDLIYGIRSKKGGTGWQQEYWNVSRHNGYLWNNTYRSYDIHHLVNSHPIYIPDSEFAHCLEQKNWEDVKQQRWHFGLEIGVGVVTVAATTCAFFCPPPFDIGAAVGRSALNAVYRGAQVVNEASSATRDVISKLPKLPKFKLPKFSNEASTFELRQIIKERFRINKELLKFFDHETHLTRADLFRAMNEEGPSEEKIIKLGARLGRIRKRYSDFKEENDHLERIYGNKQWFHGENKKTFSRLQTEKFKSAYDRYMTKYYPYRYENFKSDSRDGDVLQDDSSAEPQKKWEIDVDGCKLTQAINVMQPVVLETTVTNATLACMILPGTQLMLPGAVHIRDQQKDKLKTNKEIFNNKTEYPNYTMVAAHRGYWAEEGVPENTLEAVNHALKLGADIIEVDIRSSKDGVPMLLHDPCLLDKETGKKTRRIKDMTAKSLLKEPTYDRFGAKTKHNVVSLDSLLDTFKDLTLITLDIKDTGVEWDNTFKSCVRLIDQTNSWNNVIIKGKADLGKIEDLLDQVVPGRKLGFETNEQGIKIADGLQYTPVLYGDGFWGKCYGTGTGRGSRGSGGPGTGDGSSIGGKGVKYGQFDYDGRDCLQEFKQDWYPVIKEGKIKAVEVHYKLNSDPLFKSGVVQWLQEHNVRVGIFMFTADDKDGVINTDNGCNTIVRKYFHDPGYQQKRKAEFLNDGRGNLDWVYAKAKPDYVIHDRPDVVIDYTQTLGLRDTTKPVISRVPFPEEITLRTPPADTVQDWSSADLSTSKLTNFKGIAIKISNYSKVEFFTPNTRPYPIKTSPMKVGLTQLPELPDDPNLKEKDVTYLPLGVKKENVAQKFYNGKNLNFTGTCDQMYATSNEKDSKGNPFKGSKFQFPNRYLNEWAALYPGYEVYFNSNFWSTNGWKGDQTASERPEYWLPCTDIYGLWISNGEVLSNTVDAHDPSGRTKDACIKDGKGECKQGSAYDGRFDALVFYEDGEVEMVSVQQLDAGYLNLAKPSNPTGKNGKKIKHATSGYMVVDNGKVIDRAHITQKFNNDQKIKQRTIFGLNTKTREVYLVTINSVSIMASGNKQEGLSVEQCGQLLKKHFGCDEVMNMDSGKSAAMLTSVGTLPNTVVPAPKYLTAGSEPNGIDSKHLKQFFGNDQPMVYRNIGTFMAVKTKKNNTHQSQ